MTTLVIGATGLLGRSLMQAARQRGMEAVGAAQRNADVTLDVADDDTVTALLNERRPDLVINAAAVTDINACETARDEAWRINARAPGIIAAAAARIGAKFVHVSTDHFFFGDGPARHDESASVTLVNEYARTKYAGEAMATSAPGALIVRTNLLGYRGWHDRPTFVEWALGALARRERIALFGDSFVSSIDVATLAPAILDLAAAGARGRLNVGSSDVFSKKALIETLARRLDLSLDETREGSVADLAVRRADSLGLDVTRAEELLGRPLPGLDEIVESLAAEHERNACATTR